MTDIASSDTLDIREQIARIDRARAESDKFVAEQRKLMAEADKFTRERALAPWQIVLSSMAAGAALFGAGAAFFKLFGL